MLKKLHNRVKNRRPFQLLASAREGNVAIIAGLVLLPALVLIGGGYDIIRTTTAKSQLRTVLESAALAAASLDNPQLPQTIVDEYMSANSTDGVRFRETPLINIVEDINLNSKTITVSASGELETYFLKLVGIPIMSVNVSTSANQTATNVELSLVIDISSSMQGSKLTNLKSAASEFIDQVLNDNNIDRTSINLVPFGGTVNIADMFNEFVVAEGSATVDPVTADYNIGSSLKNGDFRFTNSGNCIEHVNADFQDSTVIPPQSRPQVPHFWRWKNFNPWCPEEASAVLFNSNDKDTLKDKIDGLTLSDGTGMDAGAMWGHKALSYEWQSKFGGDFADRPGPLDETTMKILVIMTDGAITYQLRPKNPNDVNTKNKSNRQNNITPKGNINTTSDEDKAIGHFKKTCELSRADGIIVYTIGFQIAPNGLAEELLKDCASDPSKYYLVESLDIQSAFDSIAASVNALRVTG